MPRYAFSDDVFVERRTPGKPHAGKVLAAVQPHADDVPFFCAGTVAKLIDEGYTAYLIQTTNDEKCGPTTSLGETILSNEREVDALARILGFKAVYHLGYRNHRLDEASWTELRARLVLLFRFLKVDTVLTFNPWGEWEENPDHSVTARAVEAAAWMGGMNKDYPEQIAAGIMPHSVREKYYFVARPGQAYNRVVDIGDFLEQKIAAISANKSQGPGGSHGSRLKARLAKQGLMLPELEGDDEAADRAYIRRFCLKPHQDMGAPYGLEYAEIFYHLSPDFQFIGSVHPRDVAQYVEEHAVSSKRQNAI